MGFVLVLVCDGACFAFALVVIKALILHLPKKPLLVLTPDSLGKKEGEQKKETGKDAHTGGTLPCVHFCACVRRASSWTKDDL